MKKIIERRTDFAKGIEGVSSKRKFIVRLHYESQPCDRALCEGDEVRETPHQQLVIVTLSPCIISPLL